MSITLQNSISVSSQHLVCVEGLTEKLVPLLFSAQSLAAHSKNPAVTLTPERHVPQVDRSTQWLLKPQP